MPDNGHTMIFPHFTDQEITIDGSWQGDERQFRFIGTVASSEPFVLLSLLKCGEEYHYMKHRKSNDLEAPLNLHQGKFPHDNRYQHILMIGSSANTGAVSEGRLHLADELPMTFSTGQLFASAMDSQSEPFIYLMAIAKVNIKSKRNGIWAVKSRLLEGVEDPWRDVFSRTRHGFIRAEEDSCKGLVFSAHTPLEGRKL